MYRHEFFSEAGAMTLKGSGCRGKMSVRWDEERQRFIVDYYPDGRKGKRVRLTLPCTIRDRSIADAIEKGLRSPSENSEIHPDNQSTVKDLFPLYLEYYRLHRSITTHDNMKWTYEKKFLPMLGNFKVAELDRGHITMYKRLRKEEGVKNRTVNKEMVYFMGFVRWCKVELKLKLNEFRSERLQEVKPKHIVLSLPEAIRFIRAADPYYRVYFLTLYTLGLRFFEASGLTWEDLDPENKVVIVHGKGSKERVLPVSDWLLHALKAIKPDIPKGLIFRSQRTGGRLVNPRKAIQRACERAGIEKHVHPHLLRHTLATHFMGMKINIKIIQEWLGHSREDTTAHLYTHAELDHLRDAQAALEFHLNEYLKKEDFIQTSKKPKRPYTMTEKALEARKKTALLARAAKAVTINSQQENAEK